VVVDSFYKNNEFYFFKEENKMAEIEKEGFFKRLFGGKKTGCCGVEIKEVKEEDAGEKLPSAPSTGCCTSDTSKAQ